ncbi:polysaccharide pyruvyl transferase family protein [Azohydromonas lata]|uniref:polysaccharide pyruvyl transferase family protein n=1 Tax=Azohydromonas lata TaxID=45677 RepID=UPI0009FDB6A0|nr:polysaccharide pyruvyl transferase family protein [Azohydromonas lata]
MFLLDLPFLDAIRDSENFEYDEYVQACGGNLGNFAFRRAVTRIFQLSDCTVGDYSSLDGLRAVGKQPKTIAIAAANWLGGTPDFEESNFSRHSVLSRTNCNIFTVGLGAQASLGVSSLKLGKNTLALAKLLSERCEVISVRDDFTRDVLAEHGIANVIVTGCPSNFLNLNPQLGAEVSEKFKMLASCSSWTDFRVIVSEFSGDIGQVNPQLYATAKLANVARAHYVLQTPKAIFDLKSKLTLPSGSDSIGNSYDEQPTLGPLLRELRRRSIFFASLDGWMDFARTCGFAIGSRIHGTVIPMQAGVPAILVAHDSRTIGLAKKMAVPMMLEEEFLQCASSFPRHIFEAASRTVLDFDGCRTKLAAAFKYFSQRNGLDLSQQFSDFYEAPVVAQIAPS